MGRIHTAIAAAQKQFEKDQAAAEKKLAESVWIAVNEFCQGLGLWFRAINNDYWFDFHPDNHVTGANILACLDPELEKLLINDVVHPLCLGGFLNSVDPDPHKYEWVYLEGEPLLFHEEQQGLRRRLKIVPLSTPVDPDRQRFPKMTEQVAKLLVKIHKQDPVRAGELLSELPSE